MAVDFGLLNTQLPEQIATSFSRGYEGAQQNQLARQKMAQEQETNALRRQEAELGLQRTRGLMQQEEEAQKNARLNQKISGFRERILRARTPDDARKIVQMQYSDADISPVVSQYSSLEQSLAEVPDEPTQFQEYLQKEAMGIDEWLKSQAQANVPKVVGNAVYIPSERRFVSAPQQRLVSVIGPQGQPIMVPADQAVGMTPLTAATARMAGIGAPSRAAAPTRESAGVAAPTEFLTPKEREKREAKFPQATSALKGFEAKTDNLLKDLVSLRDHEGLSDITGLLAGRIDAVTPKGARAQALYDKIVARGGFQELQDMRNASPTGGALGNVSNTEGQQLKSAFAALDRRQNAESIKKVIDDLIVELEGSKERVRDAYDMTYEYRQSSAAPSAPAKPAATGNLTPAEQAELDQLRKRFGK